MENATTSKAPDVVDEAKVLEENEAEPEGRLHLRAGEEDVEIVRTTQKVRWLMQRC